VSALERRDAVIVGGGPAGSTLARALQRAGASVTVLDKRSFPRDKTCAGWITPAVIASLELDKQDYRASGRVLQPISGFRVALMGEAAVPGEFAPDPLSYAIRRCEFDHYLLARSGAELRTGRALETLERAGDEWIVNGSLRTPLIVGAGGHFCPVARELGAELGRGEPVVGAQEFEIRMTPAQAERSPVRGDLPQLYFCADLAGYAWVVRKGDWLNVGIGRRGPQRLAEHFERFLAAMVREGVLDAELAAARAHGHAYLLYPHAARPLTADGALLIGDAAGLAYPESGEGIRPAVESALLAAQAIRACNGDFSRRALAGYAQAMERRFGARSAGRDAPLPGRLKQLAAGVLMRSRWFTREIVTRRWFLHEHVPALQAPAGAGAI
jgi:geranylgeranyl reductase family protein